MQDINEYLLWRGDLTLKQAEFNKIDSLILSQLSYVNFDDILPDPLSEDYLPLWKASELYWNTYSEEEVNRDTKVNRETAFLMKAMADTERYRDFLLGKYINRIDIQLQEQFSAMKVLLPDESVYIVFRGTDTSIVGWREDFNMAYLPRVPSQMEAVEYLEKVIVDQEQVIRLGGHSKGGNLSVYGAVNASAKIKKRITEVYNFDGPGFNEDMIHSQSYIDMLPFLHTYIPESSVVGRLLEHQEEYRVVKSSQPKLMQHDPFSWKLIGKEFVYAKEVDRSSKLMEATIKTWIGKLDYKQREQFVDSVFFLFDINDIKTTKDLSDLKLKKISEIIKTMGGMDQESKKILNKTIGLLWKDARMVLKNRKKLVY